jgi:geranylgeranyl pyrophosphate synthase
MKMKKETGRKLMIDALNLLQEKSRKALEKAKKQILSEQVASEKAREALEYYVENWDDTTHPGILGLACEAVGGKIERAEQMQIVMLYLTAAMDLHDDVIDQSKVKNGKPTVFGKYGKNVALLLGDAMMVKGFTLLYGYSNEFAPQTLEALSNTIRTGFFELGNANLLELTLKGKVNVSPKLFSSMLEKKAASIGVHVKVGAIVGGGSLNQIEALSTYGRILGTLIVLREEFIDIFEPEELRSRMKNEVLPAPILYAFEDQETKKRILTILSKRRITQEEAFEIVDHVFKNKNVERLRKHARNLAKTALDSISTMEEEPSSNLRLLIDGALEDL